MDKPIYWDEEKTEQLRNRHGIGFEEIVIAINQNKVLMDRENTSYNYRHQRQLIIEIDDYAYVVPYVADKDHVFFKTLYPSRTATRKYLMKRSS